MQRMLLPGSMLYWETDAFSPRERPGVCRKIDVSDNFQLLLEQFLCDER